MSDQDDSPVVREIGSGETIPLRWEVLRPGRPRETAIFAGDDEPPTRHLGLYLKGELVGVASLFAFQAPPMPGVRAFQLRGMAIGPAHQRAGLGGLLLGACVEHGRKAGTKVIWCNARTTAAGFYRKHGFEIVSEEFDIPDVGPHFRMLLKL
jgi:ribosomal protein S18 acetylase RimI-like enzyme